MWCSISTRVTLRHLLEERGRYYSLSVSIKQYCRAYMRNVGRPKNSQKLNCTDHAYVLRRRQPTLHSITSSAMSAAMSGRESLQSQLEHLQMKYVGTGHADTTK